MSLRTRVASAAVVALAASVAAVPSGAAQADGDTVTIRGYVFQFSKSMFRGVLPGAVVDAEINGNAPDASVVTPVVADADGYYEIEVPDDAAVSLFATVPEAARPSYDLDGSGPLPSLPIPFHTTYNQTFHTSGDDLNFVTFQVPAEPVVKQLAAGFGLNVRGDLWPYEDLDGGSGALDLNDGYGALNNGTEDVCVVASTVYRADKRIVVDTSGDQHAPTHKEYFDIFYANPPHGRAGATADKIPGAGIAGGALLNPIYFDDTVTPNPNQQKTSGDGGVLWVDVPTGTHTVSAHMDGTRFASADITCQPGRFVNASPVWGLYELHPGEQTHPATVTGLEVTTPPTTAYGAQVRIDVTVGGGAAADGYVSIEVDGTEATVARVTDGVASATFPARYAPGEHQVVARYSPRGTIPVRSSRAVTLTTTKATPKVVLVGQRVRGTQRRFSIGAVVMTNGFLPTGSVQLYAGGKKLGRPGRVTHGVFQRTVTLRRTTKVRAVYLGDTNTQRASSKARTLRVRR
ncbi:MAG: Ig-like domain-containing protein [Nocardioides sp.]|uniref:Ig-like domain-containing protein n=1 Tax=Nocardioides sp. TaxID=35761 RepID=UPI003F117515